MRDLEMPSGEEASCEEEDPEMDFSAFSGASTAASTQFVTSPGQMQAVKLQQGVPQNGTTLQQVVGMVGGVNMGEGMQFVRTLDWGATLSTPQFITLPITLPGSKPGDPQATVQIQVLAPNLLQTQQQPKYQMQIPIQGFQQGGALLTVANPSDGSDGGLQLVGNSLPEGMQMVTMSPDMQLMSSLQMQDNKERAQQPMQQVYITTQNNQIVINTAGDGDGKLNNNSLSNNNNESLQEEIIIKEECDDNTYDDESSQGTEETSEPSIQWSTNDQDVVNYLNSLPPQQTQTLPVSLQQFLRLNPADIRRTEETRQADIDADSKQSDITEAVLGEDGTLRITKKRKKYKKKPKKPAKPKPGQVQITLASDGTAIYCCPECQMAYPEKEQLEIHLSVHKIERRFICGICGAGLKRKEHLERHKLGHNPERPYVCAVCRKGFKRREHLNLHTVIHSGVKTQLCLECGKGFYRKDHLRKHTRSHETRRAREEALGLELTPPLTANGQPTNQGQPSNGEQDVKPIIAESAEITIHVPTSDNMQVPVQINIPQHVVTSLQAQQTSLQAQQTSHGGAGSAQSQLEALLAQHT